MFRIGETCRTSIFLYTQAGRDGVHKWRAATWETPESLQEAATPREMMGEGEITIFLGSKRGYCGAYSTRKPPRTTRLKGQKDHFCKDEAMFANTPVSSCNCIFLL